MYLKPGPLSAAWLAGALILTTCISLPFLPAGFGADPDAWEVARASRTLWETGRYTASRLPGYPLHEIICAPLVAAGGCTATNAGTLAATLALIVVWYGIARRHGRNPRPMFLSLALAPVVLCNAASTIDYPWSLLFILAALDAALRKRPLLAGFCTGVAAGFRPSNLTAALPLALLFAFAGGEQEHLLRFLLSTVLTTVAAFLPPLITFGPVSWMVMTREQMSDVHPAMGIRVLDFGYRIIYVLGPLAAAVLTAIAYRGRAAIRSALRGREPLMIASLSGIALFTLQFFALPLERAYLLPTVPFALLIADRVASPRASLVLFLCILSFDLFNPDIIDHAKPRPAISPAIREGRLPESWEERSEMAKTEEGKIQNQRQ